MRRAILIDDEYWALKGLQTIFPWAAHGYMPVGAYDDAVCAWEAIARERPDVVITDIRMPEMSGLDLLRAARGEGIQSEFVIVSGYGEFGYAREALQLGAFDYLLKPVSYEEAEALLARLDTHFAPLQEADAPAIAAQPGAQAHLEELIHYVRAHFHEPLQLKTLAKQFYLHPTYCSELFNKAMGISFSKFVNRLRLDQCCAQLLATPLPVEQIALRAGFSDSTHFHKVFKAALGMTPLQYRRQGRQA